MVVAKEKGTSTGKTATEGREPIVRAISSDLDDR
jgi:hypothetical protein